METYHNLLDFAVTQGSFDGGDQGLLNAYFRFKWFYKLQQIFERIYQYIFSSNWRESDVSHRLPFTYNVTTGAIYSYAAALKQ